MIEMMKVQMSKRILSEALFTDLPNELNPEEPFLFIYDNFFEMDFAEKLRAELLNSWPKELISKKVETNEVVEYRGKLLNYWHYAQSDLKILDDVQEALNSVLRERSNLLPADISAYALPGNSNQGLHTDRGFANLVIHLSVPDKHFQGGETVLYSCRLDEIVYENEVANNWTLLNSWMRSVPVKFNRAVLLNGNFTHGAAPLNTSTDDISKFRLSLTAFRRFK